jgi:hypothetical protein
MSEYVIIIIIINIINIETSSSFHPAIASSVFMTRVFSRMGLSDPRWPEHVVLIISL